MRNETISEINTSENFESRLLDLARVVKVTAGGKTLRFRATVVVGNRSGKVGMGVAKGRDVAQAVEKATKKAKKNLIEVEIVNDTIPYDIIKKYQSAKLLLKPQKQGRGIVAGGVVRTICDLAGIKNITGKLLSKTNNKINIARATINALKELKTRK